jgi:hypothetical protein
LRPVAVIHTGCTQAAPISSGELFCSAVLSGSMPTYTFQPVAFAGAGPICAENELDAVVIAAGIALAPSSLTRFTHAAVT